MVKHLFLSHHEFVPGSLNAPLGCRYDFHVLQNKLLHEASIPYALHVRALAIGLFGGVCTMQVDCPLNTGDRANYLITTCPNPGW